MRRLFTRRRRPCQRFVSLALIAGVTAAAVAAIAGIAYSAHAHSSAAGAYGPLTTTVATSATLDSVDPAIALSMESFQLEYATCAKLYNYTDLPLTAAAVQYGGGVPEIASATPTVSPDGLTLTIPVRTDFMFSGPTGGPAGSQYGERTSAAQMAYTIERALSPAVDGPARWTLSNIVGATAFASGAAPHISGLTVVSNQLRISLVDPDGSIPAQLAMPFFCAVPTATPMAVTTSPLPSAGPYYIESYNPSGLTVLKANPFYKGSRGRRSPEIDYLAGQPSTSLPGSVLAGTFDYGILGGLASGDEATIAGVAASAGPGHQPQQLFALPGGEVDYIALNTSRPPFSNVKVRQSVNLAIDRSALVAARGQSYRESPTDHTLPPAVPGSRAVNAYPMSPDLATALSLMAASGTGISAASPVTVKLYGGTSPIANAQAQVVRDSLAPLGLNVEYHALADMYAYVGTPGADFDMANAGWAVDYPDGSNIFENLLDGTSRVTPAGTVNISRFFDAGISLRIHDAAALTGEARSDAYAALDRDITTLFAPWIAYGNRASRDLFSARVGCQTPNPMFGIDLAALCQQAVPSAWIVANSLHPTYHLPDGVASSGTEDPSFTLTTSLPGSVQWYCRVDAQPAPVACPAALTLHGLAAGPHTLTAYASGASDTSSTASVSWTVISPAAPGTTFDAAALNVNLSATDFDFLDPALSFASWTWQFTYLTNLTLLNFPDRPAPEGSQLVPEAADLPVVSADGKTYTFTIRPGFRFNTGEVVTAQSFADAIDRTLDPVMQSPGAQEVFLGSIAGYADMVAGRTTHVAGVTVNGNQLIITLSRTDPAFLSKITLPFFTAIPHGLPRNPLGERTPAMAGPYYIKSYDVGRQAVFERNPFYTSSRPRNFSRIVVTINTNLDTSLAQVRSGQADYDAGGLPPSQVASLASDPSLPKRFFAGPQLETDYIALNTSRRPFDNVLLRRAVNYAVDRSNLLAARGAVAGFLSDQILPPGLSGYRRVDAYPSTPDLATAQALVAASGVTLPLTVKLYTGNRGAALLQAPLIQESLASLGINVEIHQLSSAALYGFVGTRGADFDMALVGWGADYPDASDFFGPLLDGTTIQGTNNNNLAYFDDPVFNQRIHDAAALDGQARIDAYAALDRDITIQAAPWIAYDNRAERAFFSARIGCQIFQPSFTKIDLAALCDRASADASIAGPSSTTTQAPSFVLSTTRTGPARWWCKVDTRPFVTCPAALTLHGLAGGGHLLQAYAAAPGWQSMTATVTWTATGPGPPDTVIDSTTVAGSNVTLAWHAGQPAARFQCMLDVLLWRTCTPPLTWHGLTGNPGAPVTHTIRVRSVSFAGEVEATPAVVTFSTPTP